MNYCEQLQFCYIQLAWIPGLTLLAVKHERFLNISSSQQFDFLEFSVKQMEEVDY